MKFICTQQNLNKGLMICEKIISKNFTLPILQNILLNCEKNKRYIKLSSTDLEVGIEVIIPAKIEEEGSITVPAKLFNSFIKNLPQENIEVTEKNKLVSVQCKNYKSSIKGESSKEFPLIPKIENDENMIPIKSNDFFQGLSFVLNSVSILDIKPEISGAYIQFNENNITFTGTDSFRLSEKKIALNEKNKYTDKIIIPKKTGDVFLRIFQDTNEPLNIQLTDNQIFIQNAPSDTLIPKIKIVSRTVEGEYPNYEHIIPSSFLTTIKISKKDLIQHIRTAGLFSSKINDVTFKINPKKQEVNIVAKDQDSGDHFSAIPCEIEGEELEVIFNFTYLLDGLGYINSPEVEIKLNQETTPVLISSDIDKSFKYVLMPIKI